MAGQAGPHFCCCLVSWLSEPVTQNEGACSSVDSMMIGLLCKTNPQDCQLIYCTLLRLTWAQLREAVDLLLDGS